MIDFSVASFTKVDNANPGDADALLDGLLLDGETVHAAYQGAKNVWVAFTDRRIIVVTAQGITGKRRDYTTLPYSGISLASVNTTNGFDADASMDLWLGDPGITAQAGLVTPCRIHLEFVPGVDARGLERFVVGRML